jgi:NifB/MoaA-like Fe-S oxidoreductase
LIEQLKPRASGGVLLIPSAMLRHDGDLFLDDISPGDVQNALGLKVVVVPVDGGSFLSALMS